MGSFCANILRIIVATRLNEVENQKTATKKSSEEVGQSRMVTYKYVTGSGGKGKGTAVCQNGILTHRLVWVFESERVISPE